MPSPKSSSKKTEPETFSLTDYTASLDAFTMEARIDAESSMYRWAQVVIGYDKLPADVDYHLYEPIHRPMCDRAENVLPIKGRENRKNRAKLLDLEPRGSLKTHLVSATTALYYLVFNYDGRILISSHNQDAAKDILTIVKWNIEFNETFKRFYGNWAYYARKYGVWRDDNIRLAFRTQALRDPTIDTAGAEMSKTGGHYDVIIVDDIQDRENVQTQVQRKNVRERFMEYLPQLEPRGGLLVPATRYHRADIYGWLIKKREESIKRLEARNLGPTEREEAEKWLFEVVVRRAWNDDGSLYYPTRLTESLLGELKDTLEDYLFSVWYLNEPLDETAKVFINPYDNQRDFDFVRGPHPYIKFPNNAPARPVFMTMSWDPKGRDNPNRPNDAHGIIVNGTDYLGGWWTMEALELRMPLDALLDRICLLIKHYCVSVLSIETLGSGTQGLWVDLLRKVLPNYGLADLRIVEYSPGNQNSKDARIRSLQPQHRRGLWHFKRNMCDPLLAQLDDFPMVEHDDLLDAAVQQIGVARPPDPDDTVMMFADEEDFDKGEPTGGAELTDGAWVGLGTPTGAVA